MIDNEHASGFASPRAPRLERGLGRQCAPRQSGPPGRPHWGGAVRWAGLPLRDGLARSRATPWPSGSIPEGQARTAAVRTDALRVRQVTSQKLRKSRIIVYRVKPPPGLADRRADRERGAERRRNNAVGVPGIPRRSPRRARASASPASVRRRAPAPAASPPSGPSASPSAARERTRARSSRRGGHLRPHGPCPAPHV